jgi:hypothetical protein
MQVMCMEEINTSALHLHLVAALLQSLHPIHLRYPSSQALCLTPAFNFRIVTAGVHVETWEAMTIDKDPASKHNDQEQTWKAAHNCIRHADADTLCNLDQWM